MALALSLSPSPSPRSPVTCRTDALQRVGIAGGATITIGTDRTKDPANRARGKAIKHPEAALWMRGIWVPIVLEIFLLLRSLMPPLTPEHQARNALGVP